MTNLTPNLRKAAVFIRSLDGETAARLLTQLSPEEANEIRTAIRALGELDPDEQADVAAEFRRSSPVAAESTSQGVELELSMPAPVDEAASHTASPASGKRFEFLEQAPIDALVPYLAREHAQTIAVVLSHLPPERGAAVLAAMPAKTQVEIIERLGALGETDPESVSVLERELSAWLTQRSLSRRGGLRGGTVMSILSAAGAPTRDAIMASLNLHNGRLAKQIAQLLPSQESQAARPEKLLPRQNMQAAALQRGGWEPSRPVVTPPSSIRATAENHAIGMSRPTPAVAPRLPFDDLLSFNDSELAAVVRSVDSQLLLLSLVGSSDELVDRFCRQMPRGLAKAFRRQLNHLGPTRLSDVERAQQAVASGAMSRRIANSARSTSIAR